MYNLRCYVNKCEFNSQSPRYFGSSLVYLRPCSITAWGMSRLTEDDVAGAVCCIATCYITQGEALGLENYCVFQVHKPYLNSTQNIYCIKHTYMYMFIANITLQKVENDSNPKVCLLLFFVVVFLLQEVGFQIFFYVITSWTE